MQICYKHDAFLIDLEKKRRTCNFFINIDDRLF